MTPTDAPTPATADAAHAETAAVDRAITSRRSIRAFLPTPVPRAVIDDILQVAARSPSGTNTQPWQVHVLTGASRDRLCQTLLAAHDDPAIAAQHQEDYAYYPARWTEPFLSRRRKVGWELYGLLGLTRDDKAGMHRQHGRNYQFFDAPVGLIFTIDRSLSQGSWLDYGMFLQSVMVAARARGLDTCPQAAFNPYHRLIAEHLALPPEQAVVCGMALGHADRAARVNQFTTERAPVADFTRYYE